MLPNWTLNQLRWNYPPNFEHKSILGKEILVQKISCFEDLQFPPGGNNRKNELSISFEWVAGESREYWEQLIRDTLTKLILPVVSPWFTHFSCFKVWRSIWFRSEPPQVRAIRTSLIRVDRRYCCCCHRRRFSWWWCHWFIGHQFTNSKRIFSGNLHFAKTDDCHITICIEWTRACVCVCVCDIFSSSFTNAIRWQSGYGTARQNTFSFVPHLGIHWNCVVIARSAILHAGKTYGAPNTFEIHFAFVGKCDVLCQLAQLPTFFENNSLNLLEAKRHTIDSEQCQNRK